MGWVNEISPDALLQEGVVNKTPGAFSSEANKEGLLKYEMFVDC